MQRTVRVSLRLILALVFLLLAGRPEAQPPAKEADQLDAVVFVIARGGATDPMSIAYWSPVTNAQVEQDFRRITDELHKAPVRPKIKRDSPQPGRPQLTSGDAELPGLVNWGAGVINLDPILAALQRYGHIQLQYIFFSKFNLTWPVREERRGPLHWKTQVNGQTIAYDVWIDHSQPLGDRLPGTGQWGVTWLWIAGLATGALLLVGGLFYWMHTVTHGRSPSAPERKG
jgi:hypothetical protein